MLIKKTIVALGAASFVLLAGGLVGAQTATGTATTSTSTTTNKEGDRLASSYSSLAGSPENAISLVNGLRTSSVIELSASPTAPSASVSPATGKMGWGNVNIALALTQTSLTQQNITNPTPAQVASALSGVLDARASGMGWGQIANSMGVSLGSVMSAANKNAKATAASAKATTASAKATGIAQAGKSSKNSDGKSSGQGAGSGGKGNGNGGGGNAGGNGGGNGGGGGKGGGGGRGRGGGRRGGGVQ